MAVELEVDWVKDMKFSTHGIVIDRPGTRNDTELFIRGAWDQIANWITKAGLETAEVRFSTTEQPIKIWASLSEMINNSPNTTRAKLFTAPVIQVWTPELVKAFKDSVDTDQPAGMVNLETEDQIWINDIAEQLLQISGLDAVKLNMKAFWHPEDLERLKQKINEVDADGGKFIFNYRCRLAASPTGWANFENEYELINGLYRLGITRRQPEPIAVPALV